MSEKHEAGWDRPCGTTDDGEEAFCTVHLAELTGRTRSQINGEVRGWRSDGSVSCGHNTRSRVIPLGVILGMGLDEVGFR